MATGTKEFNYVSEIWGIADYVRDIIKRAEYNKVILPFTLLRRIECALEPTRLDVTDALKMHESEWSRENDLYRQYSGRPFYNVSSIRLSTIPAYDTFETLMEYINSFSPNAREILEKSDMENTCKRLQDGGLLYEVCRRFSTFDLSPEAVSDREMSNIYEHLIERFGEEIAEDAEDFMTPKDVVRLAVSMLFSGEDDVLNDDKGHVRTLYDPTIGTGGFVSDALDLLEEWHKEKKMTAPTVIVPYGQEVAPETYAIAKSSMMLRGVEREGNDLAGQITDPSTNIKLGDTLADDQFPGMTFTYCLSNPPYGKNWQKSQDAVMDEAKLGFRGRFGAGLPSIDDGSMLFLQHVANKMAPASEGGGKAGIVLSASPLFTGDAGSGPSNIRRWLFQEDLVDCIVKLGVGEFYRTGINTYLWILSTKKPENRKGKIQLIDASEMFVPMRKNQGNKRNEISAEQRDEIVRMYADGVQNEKSVIVPVEAFMYRKVTTYRPLRMGIIPTADKLDKLYESKAMSRLTEEQREALKRELEPFFGQEKQYVWAGAFAKAVAKVISTDKVKVTPANLAKAVADAFGVRDAKYDISYDNNGVIVDPESKDSENIPYTMDFDEYMQKEVLPYAPETHIDESVMDSGPLQDGKVGVVGTRISFNEYFYHYEEPRRPEEIAKEILELEDGLEGFMKEFLA